MRLVIHSVINNTGASRFLRCELLRGTEGGVIFTWVPVSDAVPGWTNIFVARMTALEASRPLRALSKIGIIIQQFFILVVNSAKYADIFINSVSNLGAIFASFFVSFEQIGFTCV